MHTIQTRRMNHGDNWGTCVWYTEHVYTPYPPRHTTYEQQTALGIRASVVRGNKHNTDYCKHIYCSANEPIEIQMDQS